MPSLNLLLYVRVIGLNENFQQFGILIVIEAGKDEDFIIFKNVRRLKRVAVGKRFVCGLFHSENLRMFMAQE